MKFTRKFVPALALLIVSALLMTTATFAWFSMNTRATATGMQMDTEAGDNVLISGSTNDDKAADTTFKSALVKKAPAANLRPVSSVDGANFYYVKNSSVVDGSGAATSPSGYEPYAKYDPSNRTAFKNAYHISAADTVDGYVEYEFQVMAVNDGTAAKTLVFDNVDLTYGGSADVQKAFRAAIFVDDITTAAAPAEKTLKTILRVDDAAYYSSTQAVNSTTTKTNVDPAKLDASAILGSVPAGETKYYKVIVRVWLEGEDTTCNNKTFAKLDEVWSLDLGISFASTSSAPPVSAVKYLNHTYRSVTLVEANGYTVGTEYQVIDAGVYYPILLNGQPVEVVSGQSYLYTTTTPATGFASVDNFYALTKDAVYGTYHYPINVTPQYTVIDAVDLTAATAADGATVLDPTPADPASGDEVSYYAITGKLLDGEQLYTKATGAVASNAEIYTIDGSVATSVTEYCFLPVDLTAATAADGETNVVLDPTPADPASGDEVTYYAVTGKFLKGVQVYANASGAITATSVISTISGGVATPVTEYCKLPAGTP